MKNIFDDLSLHIAEDWKSKSCKLEAFTEVAFRQLERFTYSLSQDELDRFLAEWFLKKKPLPEQVNVHNTFGQPPVTLFNNGKFVLDIYIWLNFDTSIHSHGFRGAFKVLHGSSLHEVFKVTEEAQYAPDVMKVLLGTPEMELLKPGDLRRIEPEKGLTHRVIHLKNPTVTLCAKTINEPEISQWNYFLNGLAIQKRPASAPLVKKIYYAQYLWLQNAGLASSFLNQLLDQLPLSVQMNLYEDIWAGSLDLTEENRQFIVDLLISRHGESEWFKLYEDANPQLHGHIDFSEFNEAFMRLLGHFINCDYSLSGTKGLLEHGRGKTLSTDDIAKASLKLPAENPQQRDKIKNFLNS